MLISTMRDKIIACQEDKTEQRKAQALMCLFSMKFCFWPWDKFVIGTKGWAHVISWKHEHYYM